MPVFSRIAAIMAAALFILTISGLSVRADTNRATFPKNFDKFVLYATYDRGSSKEEAFATPETIELSKSGKPLPAGTQLVLGIWTDYKLTGYFVMEKGVGWGADFNEEQRTGDWHFQQFDTSMQVRQTEIAARCQSCHQSQAGSDFMYTLGQMREYLP
jgi:cytochrome P460